MVNKQNDDNILGINVEETCKRIGGFIDKSGLSDKKLGNMMGLSVQSINKWRHGYTMPDIENLYILSRIMGIKVDDFLVPREKKALRYDYHVKQQDNSVTRRLWAYIHAYKKCVKKALEM